VVGGGVGLALIAGLFFLLSRRARPSPVGNKLQGNLQQPPVEAEGIEQQRHEMEHNPGEDGAVKYVPHGADPKVVQFEGPPREMPANQPELMRHELA